MKGAGSGTRVTRVIAPENGGGETQQNRGEEPECLADPDVAREQLNEERHDGEKRRETQHSGGLPQAFASVARADVNFQVLRAPVTLGSGRARGAGCG